MARQGTTSLSTTTLLLVAAIATGGLVLGWVVFGRATDPFGTTPQLDVQAYTENSNSLRGNVYKVEGEVVDSLAWSPSLGRLIAIGVGPDKRLLPVQVTTEFSSTNIQKGQKFLFLLEVNDNGILRTKKLTKT